MLVDLWMVIVDAVQLEDVGVYCESTFVSMAVYESDLHTNVENIAQHLNDVTKNSLTWVTIGKMFYVAQTFSFRCSLGYTK